MKPILCIAAAFVTVGISSAAFAVEPVPVEMKNGAFFPATITVPAKQKIMLMVKNSEAVETEFESYELNREVKVKPGNTATIFVGPLDPGTYPIFDDNNPDAKGSIVAQ